jgi:DNA-binding transcriptional regulator GbsR (MarR family)
MDSEKSKRKSHDILSQPLSDNLKIRANSVAYRASTLNEIRNDRLDHKDSLPESEDSLNLEELVDEIDKKQRKIENKA